MLLRRLVASLLSACAIVVLAACGETPPVTLQGTITDSYTDQPVAGATVQLGETTLSPDANGSYTTTEWSGDDTVTIAAPGYATYTLDLLGDAVPTDAEPGSTVSFAVQLRPNTLAGTVTSATSEQPLANALVAVLVVSGTATVTLAEATTAADGSFQLADVPEEFTLQVQATDHALYEEQLSRTTSHAASLFPNTLSGTVTDSLSGAPLAGATVTVGRATATTGNDGFYRLTDLPIDATEISFDADGYAGTQATFDLAASQTLTASLRPDVLQGTLIDQVTGEPIPHATIIAGEQITSTAVTSVRIDRSPDGSFRLDDVPETGYVQVLAPGYRKAVFEIAAGGIPDTIALEPFKARALYVKTSTAAYMPERMEEFWQKLDETELNAMVIDLKSDNMVDLGLIYYDSQVPLIQELGTSQDLMDIGAILAEAKRRNVYTIARIHVFSHDNVLAETRPDWAAQNRNGCVPNENRKCNGPVFYADFDVAWLDPWNRNVWDYNIQLGVEAAQLGFDEIQFDYIRFPSDASDIKNMVLSGGYNWREDPDALYNNIAELLSIAHEEFNTHGAYFSADIFGYAAFQPQPSIGQRADLMSQHTDYLCPMIYPSHFLPNELGFANAAAHPYEIIEASLARGEALIDGNRAKQRPWLQAFTLVWVPDSLRVNYGDREVRAQIDATEDSPYGYGWALWDPDNHYEWGAIRPDPARSQTGSSGQ